MYMVALLPFAVNAVLLCGVPLAVGALAMHPEWLVTTFFAMLRWSPDYFQRVARRMFGQIGIELQNLCDDSPPAAEVLPPTRAPMKLGSHSDAYNLSCISNCSRLPRFNHLCSSL